MADENKGSATVTPPATGSPTAGAGAEGAAGAAGAGAGAAEGEEGSIAGGSPAAGTEGAGKPAGEGGKPPTPQGAPEKYAEFKLPDGIVIEPKVLETVHAAFKKIGLTQDAAQELITLQAQQAAAQQEAQAKAYNEVRAEWQKQTREKVLGSKPDEVKALVAKARDAFGDKELVDILNQTGVGDHPAVVRFFAAIGRAIAEDNVPDGGRGGAEKSHAEILYGPKKD